MRASLFLVLAACSAPSSTAPPAARPVPPSAASPAPTAASAVVLPPATRMEAGTAIERPIKAGEAHRYSVEVPAGHAVTGVVTQHGIDVEVIAYGPDGKQLASFDSPNGANGPEPFEIEAKVAGRYDFEVRPFVEPAAPNAASNAPPITQPQGKYDARVEVLTPDAHAELRAKARFASPRIRALWAAARLKRQDVLDKAWQELAGKSPIVEPYPGEGNDVLVSFVFRATAPYVGLIGGDGFREKPLVRLPDSDLWTLTMRMPADSRFGYAFLVADAPPDYHRPFTPGFGRDPRFAGVRPDPNNKQQQFGMSLAELPGAAPQPWIAAKPEVPKGTVKPLTIASKRLSEERKLGVYTPPGYDPKKRYPLLIVFDGEAYGLSASAMIPLPTILDNLIAAKKIPPIVAALVANQGTRERDLPGSEAFSAFLAKELVPKLRAEFRAGLSAAETIVTGSSFGGLCSAYTALHHSDVIGNVLSQSGSYQFKREALRMDVSPSVEGGWLIKDYAAAKKLPIKFYLDAGRFEDELLASNRHMRDVLVAKGYAVTYAEFSGGHDYGMWRHTIADGLIALLRK